MRFDLHHGTLRTSFAFLLILLGLCVALVMQPQKAEALALSPCDSPSSVQMPDEAVAGEGARRALYDDVIDTYRLFTGIAGGVALQDYYFGETTKGLAYRQYYIRKAPTLLRIETYGPGKLTIPGYGSATGSVEVWQYSYEVH